MKEEPWRTFLRGRKHPSDLIITITFSIFCALSTLLFQAGGMVRILLGLPLLLFFPGYSLISMLYPGKNHQKGQPDENEKKSRNLDDVERAVFSIGLSLVLVSLVGLALNYVATITLVPILTSLVGLTVTFSLIAWYLRSRLPEEERFRHSFLISEKTKEAVTRDKQFTAFLVCCIVLVTSIVVYLAMNPVDNSAYSEFYLLDQNGTLTSLPTNLAVNQTGSVIITIRSHEKAPRGYMIVAGVENSTAPMTYSNGSTTAELSPERRATTNTSLNDGEAFEQEFAFSFPAPGRYRVVWNLMIDGEETEYRLHLWVNVV